MIWLIFMILTLLFLCFLEEPLPVGCKNSHKRSLSTGDNLNQGDTPGTNSVAWTEVFSSMKVNYKKVMQRKLHWGDSLMTTCSVPSMKWTMQRIKNIERLFKGKSIGGGRDNHWTSKSDLWRGFPSMKKPIQRINQHAGAFFGLDQSLPLLIWRVL